MNLVSLGTSLSTVKAYLAGVYRTVGEEHARRGGPGVSVEGHKGCGGRQNRHRDWRDPIASARRRRHRIAA